MILWLQVAAYAAWPGSNEHTKLAERYTCGTPMGARHDIRLFLLHSCFMCHKSVASQRPHLVKLIIGETIGHEQA